MNLEEVGKILTIIASFDNRKLETSTAMAWKMMLDRHVPEARLQDAEEVVFDWFGTENPYFEVRHLVDGLKRIMRVNRLDIEADVRSAKARGLIGKDWHPYTALPWSVRVQLQELRDTERAELQALNASYDPDDRGTVAIEVGKRVE